MRTKALLLHIPSGKVVELKSMDLTKTADVVVHHGPCEGQRFVCPASELKKLCDVAA